MLGPIAGALVGALAHDLVIAPGLRYDPPQCLLTRHRLTVRLSLVSCCSLLTQGPPPDLTCLRNCFARRRNSHPYGTYQGPTNDDLEPGTLRGARPTLGAQTSSQEELLATEATINV
jgi:hypothetical protein